MMTYRSTSSVPTLHFYISPLTILHLNSVTATNELLITFATNSDEKPLQNTPWIYVPFPVRFNYKKIESGQNIVQAGSYTFRMKTNGYVLNANADGTATSWYYFNQVWNVTISNGRCCTTSIITMIRSHDFTLHHHHPPSHRVET